MERDKVLHFLCSALIALLAFPIIGWWALPVALFIGVCKEVYDWFSYGLFSLGDLLADTLGIAVATLIISLIKIISL